MKECDILGCCLHVFGRLIDDKFTEQRNIQGFECGSFLPVRARLPDQDKVSISGHLDGSTQPTFFSTP